MTIFTNRNLSFKHSVILLSYLTLFILISAKKKIKAQSDLSSHSKLHSETKLTNKVNEFLEAKDSSECKVMCDIGPDRKIITWLCADLASPVCGFYTENCGEELCQKDFKNECLACSENRILYYIEGNCLNPTQEPIRDEAAPDDPTRDIINDGKMSEDPTQNMPIFINQCLDESRNSEICTEEYDPVCGITEECSYDYHYCETYSNSCLACSNPAVLFFNPGKCSRYCKEPMDHSLDTKCTEEERNNTEPCPLLFAPEPTCGVTFGCEYDTGTCETYSSRCEACKNPDIHYYFKGECCADKPIEYPPNPFFDRTYCDNNERPTECAFFTIPTDPVCGFLKGCDPTKNICLLTYPSGCDACLDHNIIEYTAGKCPEPNQCTEEQRNIPCTEEYKGVCAIGKICNWDSSECNYNSGTGCQACSNPDVDRYYDYECYTLSAFNSVIEHCITPIPVPVEIKTYKCTDEDRTNACPTDEYEGVCAHKGDECTSECEFISATFCTACQDPEVIWVSSECIKYMDPPTNPDMGELIDPPQSTEPKMK